MLILKFLAFGPTLKWKVCNFSKVQAAQHVKQIVLRGNVNQHVVWRETRSDDYSGNAGGLIGFTTLSPSKAYSLSNRGLFSSIEKRMEQMYSFSHFFSFHTAYHLNKDPTVGRGGVWQ